MNFFGLFDKIELAYDRMNYDQKAEFSECMKTVSTTERIMFYGGLALLVFKMIKK